MTTLELPFGETKHFCGICSHEASDPTEIKLHEMMGTDEEMPAELAQGMRIEVDDRLWRDDWFELAPESSQPWTVERLFYEWTATGNGASSHRLMVVLRRETPAAGTVSREVPYRDLKLFWKRGTRQ